jgi:hypothetical protein
VKRGEYGAILSADWSRGPRVSAQRRFDPTGAATARAADRYPRHGATCRRAPARHVYGSASSFIVEDFGGRRLRTLTRDDVDGAKRFVARTEF